MLQFYILRNNFEQIIAIQLQRLHGIISIVDNVWYLVSSLYKTGSSAVSHTVYIFLVALYVKYRGQMVQVCDTVLTS